MAQNLARRPARVYYKHLVDGLNMNGLTLERAIRQAFETATGVGILKVKDRWRSRCRSDSDDERIKFFVNHHQIEEHHFFSDLVTFTEGKSQALISQDDVPEVDVTQFPPPEQQQFLHSQMFWLAKGNHVFLIQSQSLRSDALEQYLSWLLGTCTSVIPATTALALVDSLDIDLEAPDLPDIPDPQTINIGGIWNPAEDEVPEDVPHDVTVEEDLGTVATGHEKRWVISVLSAVFGDEQQAHDLLKNLPEDAKLRIGVQLGYSRTKRGVSRNSLRDILVAARNLPDSDFQARTADGIIKGSQIRLTHDARIVMTGDLLDPNDVKRAMLEAYRNFVENGKIEP